MEQHGRMCIACRGHKDKREMRRVVKSPTGEIGFDPTGKQNGRGAYVCSAECLNKCKKQRLLNRAFKCEVSAEVYQRLEDEFGGVGRQNEQAERPPGRHTQSEEH